MTVESDYLLVSLLSQVLQLDIISKLRARCAAVNNINFEFLFEKLCFQKLRRKDKTELIQHTEMERVSSVAGYNQATIEMSVANWND